ncbi:MAG: TadE/TadG family type IV pilus assembly protein [Candidatus Acidiferrales bacterium]
MEFALIFLVLMTMILGIIDFCRAAYSYHFVSEAAREATRWAAVNGATCGAAPAGDNSCNGTAPMNNGPASASDIQTYVTNLAPPGIDTSSTGCGGSACLATSASWTPVANGPTICSAAVNGVGPYPNYPGCTVEVEVSYTFNFIFPLVRTGTLTLSSTSEMVIAH